MWYWANMCNITGINAEASLQINIDKLKARYPEKFNEELAVNRDLEKEREILRNGYEPGKPL